MRILITGCRYWLDYKMVQDVIKHALSAARNRGEPLYVRHGKCRSGADKYAANTIWQYNQAGITDIIEEDRPARWQHENCTHVKGTRRDGSWYCKAAGPIRNQEMVDEGGIDEVHAFPLEGGRGTQDCMARARDAGLPIFNHGSPVDLGSLVKQEIS